MGPDFVMVMINSSLMVLQFMDASMGKLILALIDNLVRIAYDEQ